MWTAMVKNISFYSIKEGRRLMNKWAGLFVEKYLNGGTALVLMGAQWLYLWTFPWYQSYINNPHWGHNYAEAIAFLAIGLAYFNRRLLSYILAFLATLLVIPASLELVPHSMTAITGALLLLLIALDILIERKRQHDLGQPSNRQLTFWLKKHLPRFSYLMLAHIALVYFLVRLPAGTYEMDLVTKVFNGMLFPFVVLLLLEDMAGITNGTRAKRLGFFWGMATILISLGILSNQPGTWPTMAFTLIVAVLSITVLLIRHKPVK